MFNSLSSPLDLKEAAGTLPKPKLVRSTIPPLTETETEAAIPVLNRTEGLSLFSKVDRRYADPEIMNQKIVLVSFVPSSKAKPDNDGVYGMMKVRGVFATEQEANERAEFLIRNTDSVHEIFHAYVGRPFPVTVQTGFEKELQTIDIRKKTVDLISEDILSKKRKEKEEMEQLQEKEKLLLEGSEKALKNEPQDAFEVYITNQVKRAQLVWTYQETKKKMVQMKESYSIAHQEIEKAEEENPSFKEEYKEKYMKARRDAGIPDDENSFLKYLGLDIDMDSV
jgi:hypothetical protein